MGGNSKYGRHMKHDARYVISIAVCGFVFLAFCFICINCFAQAQQPAKPQAQTQTSSDGSLSGINMEDFGQQTDGKIVWRENPFVQPANDIAVTDLMLTGIVYSDDNSAAIVNNEIVSVGDRVGVSQVIAIEKERIILRNENGIFSLSIGGR